MRIAVMALVVLAGVACKDKTPAKKEPPAARQTSNDPPPSLDVPDVKGPGLVSADGLGPKVTLTKTELAIDGQTIATFTAEGTIDRTRLDAAARLLADKVTGDATLAIAVDKAVPYRRLAQLLEAFARAGFRRFGLLTGNNQMIPLDAPDPAAANAPGLRLVISVDRTQLRLWSVSGQEGTRQQPKLSMAAGDAVSYEPLTRALAEIVQRRWPLGQERLMVDRMVIVDVDASHSAQSLLSLLAAIRSDGSRELFPNIVLAGGG
jgi:hypothetical protein